ncbi:isocitrate lyase/PEP mutase family protein [Falsiroseomonas tokyonensis]|uniref:Oxaloacetate decarboxylase n=1 Tax=Falsiroseomonas tokyonensis TaxID=430521 RepID=A0ABV7BVK3_9PROT|nr:isocitrate lyase/PEP mutase family protein [Falsiroseomonas tokyonensis]MBU8539295.1 isocitrate lyase/PEP mutase family protein [Falsiroseomonas tokyonensis]
MPDAVSAPSGPVLPIGLADAAGRNRRLRQLLAGPELLLAPGAFDCVTARLVDASGFKALYITGAGISMSALGAPDVAALSFGEIIDRIRRICDVVSIPVIADGDTGYGGPLNVIRTVREYERAGVSAIQIEDQEWPKKCGHEPGRKLVSTTDMQMRIRAAVEARRDPDFVVIARTDARAGEGLAAAIGRARAYREAGADVIFVESPQSEAELEDVGRAFPEVPLLANMVEGGKTPILPAERLQELGFRLAIYPNAMTRLIAKAGMEMLASLKETGSTNAVAGSMYSHGKLWELFDNATWRALEDRYLRVETPAKG